MSYVSNKLLYQTRFGNVYVSDANVLLDSIDDCSIDLVITSPPFALQRKKEYGNKDQNDYVDWLVLFAGNVHRVLKDTGSFVLDLGGAYRKGRPVRSLYNYRLLIRLCDEYGFNLAEEFFWHNPSKLPSPIEWVNKKKIRVKDSVNTVWWLSKTDFPKTHLERILNPYSERMQKLLSDPEQFYKPKKRPSGHNISNGFGIQNGGAIPSNLLQIPNTDSNSKYLRLCKKYNAKKHPARFPVKLPAFFIEFLTDPGDIVLDFFAGSNATGEAAEMLQRNWISCDLDQQYLAASAFRFFEEPYSELHDSIYNRLVYDVELPVQLLGNVMHPTFFDDLLPNNGVQPTCRGGSF
ncbi:MAG: site-specific DNA-methyltransferase [Dehalococcoidia bacterium]